MSEIEDLRRDVIELRDWKEAVLGKCKASSGWDDLKWGGDKEGWGFVHYFIGHLNTRALEAEAALATPTAAQGEGKPVAWTNEAQLGFLKDPEWAEAPMAMWGKRTDKYADIPLYASPVPSAEGK